MRLNYIKLPLICQRLFAGTENEKLQDVVARLKKKPANAKFPNKKALFVRA